MSTLISVARLMEMSAGGEDPTILDVRWSLGGPPGHEGFVAGHISGAAFIHLETDLADPPGAEGRHPLPDPERFAAAMRAAGVRRHRPVVVYDQSDGVSAARAWWLLSHHGHDSVRLLDGGLDAWLEAGGSVDTGAFTPHGGDFVAQPGRLPTLDADGAGKVAHEGVLLDVRTHERFTGKHEPVDPVAGHIPGAVSAPLAGTIGGGGRMLDPTSLQQRYADLGVRDDLPIGVYCGSGVTAAHSVLALRAAGIDAALYPGSWSGWITDPERPVATGP